jgi:hypothetical protein
MGPFLRPGNWARVGSQSAKNVLAVMLWPGKDSKAKFWSEYPVLLETIAHLEKYGVLYSAKRNNI